MTNVAQAVHYTRFELVRLKWWWLSFIAFLLLIVVTPTAPVGGNMARPAVGWLVLPVLLPVFIIAFAFVMARANVPGDRSAFVGAKPLAPDTLPLAHFIHGALLMAVVSGAALTVVRGYGIPMPDAAQWLAAPLLGLLLLLLGALQVGMVAASIGQALAVWGGIVVVQAITAPFFAPDVWSLKSSAPLRTIQASMLVAGVALCLAAYRLPVKRMIIRTSGALFAALAYMGYCADMAVRPTGESGRMAQSANVPLRERVVLGKMPDWNGGGAVVSLLISGSRSDRLYRFEDAGLLLQGTDSLRSAGVAPSSRSAGMKLTATSPAADVAAVIGIPNVTWEEKSSRGRRTDAPTIHLAGDMRTDRAVPVVTQVEWSGTLVRYRVERLAEAPLAIGELFAVNGSRWRLGRDGERLSLYTASLHSPIGEFDRSEFDRSEFDQDFLVVIDSTERRAMRLPVSGGSRGGAPFLLPTRLIIHGSSALRKTVVLDEVLHSGRPASIALYRFVEDGRTPVVVRRQVDDWPVRTAPLATRLPVGQSSVNITKVPR